MFAVRKRMDQHCPSVSTIAVYVSTIAAWASEAFLTEKKRHGQWRGCRVLKVLMAAIELDPGLSLLSTLRRLLLSGGRGTECPALVARRPLMAATKPARKKLPTLSHVSPARSYNGFITRLMKTGTTELNTTENFNSATASVGTWQERKEEHALMMAAAHSGDLGSARRAYQKLTAGRNISTVGALAALGAALQRGAPYAVERAASTLHQVRTGQRYRNGTGDRLTRDSLKAHQSRLPIEAVRTHSTPAHA
ncbi:MAG TPA: hypothetical protein VF637_13285 [Sphingomicrobium sp.]|jgi:hypothetical protein